MRLDYIEGEYNVLLYKTFDMIGISEMDGNWALEYIREDIGPRFSSFQDRSVFLELPVDLIRCLTLLSRNLSLEKSWILQYCLENEPSVKYPKIKGETMQVEFYLKKDTNLENYQSKLIHCFLRNGMMIGKHVRYTKVLTKNESEVMQAYKKTSKACFGEIYRMMRGYSVMKNAEELFGR